MYLTYEMLEKAGSCDLAKYKLLFPDNILVTCNSLNVAQFKGFDLMWFAQHFLTSSIFNQYIKHDFFLYHVKSELPYVIYMAIGEQDELGKKQKAMSSKEKARLLDEFEAVRKRKYVYLTHPKLIKKREKK
jgi:hypothetical protein